MILFCTLVDNLQILTFYIYIQMIILNKSFVVVSLDFALALQMRKLISACTGFTFFFTIYTF